MTKTDSQSQRIEEIKRRIDEIRQSWEYRNIINYEDRWRGSELGNLRKELRRISPPPADDFRIYISN